MKVTQQAIADRVGVSRTVVTEALHRSPGARINSATRKEILKVARQMGYQPRNLTTHNIAYVLSIEEMKLETENSLLIQFERSFRAHGYRLTFASTDIEHLDELSEILNPKTADGVIFSRWYEGKIKNLLSSRLPWILTSDEFGVGEDVDLVALDTVQTTCNIVEHLVEKGHQRLGLVVGQSNVKYHQGLIQGMQRGLQEANLPLSHLKLIQTWHNNEISAHLLPLMEKPDAPTALVVASQGRATAAVYALRCAGYRIPEDVSVVSVIDNERFLSTPPMLTVTNALGSQFVEVAAQRLLEKMNKPDSPPQHKRIPGQVIEHDSVAPPSKKQS